MSYECRLHSGEIFHELPDNAILIGKRRGAFHLYQIDGVLHDVRTIFDHTSNRKHIHVRWHKNKLTAGCLFCYPPPPEPPPEVIFVPPMLAQPDPIPEPDIIPEPEIELEPEPEIELEPHVIYKPTKSFTTMKAAFKRFRR